MGLVMTLCECHQLEGQAMLLPCVAMREMAFTDESWPTRHLMREVAVTYYLCSEEDKNSCGREPEQGRLIRFDLALSHGVLSY